jgi:RNA polymerase sigma factor (sigma-70 family)
MDALSPTVKSYTSNEPEEVEMVAAARKNPELFALLYDRYVIRVYRYMLHHTRNESEAEDLTSQVFLDALKSLPNLTQRIPFSAWLFTIARRRVADYYRGLHPTTSLDETRDIPSSEDDPLKQVIQTERLYRLERQIAQLEEREREILRLRFSAELSFVEIGILLGLRENTVKKSFYRLLDRLGSKMESKND